VKWIKLKEPKLCVQRKRQIEREREKKTERKHSFFPFFSQKKITPAKKIKNKK
jgi:hypothetical protein